MSETGPLARPELWNVVAGGYVEMMLPMFERFASDALALVDLSPRAAVIDVAAGPGTVSLLAARNVARVVAS